MENTETDKNLPAEVRVEKDGPIVIKGYFSFKDSSGNITTAEQEIYICRCGHSSNKPYCDDSHLREGVRN